MIYKMPASGNRFFTALGVFLFCAALPLKADVPDIPPPPVRLPNGTAVSGPVLAVVLLGLVLLTAGIFYILHTKYSRTSQKTEVTAAPAAAAAPSPMHSVHHHSPVPAPVQEEVLTPAR